MTSQWIIRARVDGAEAANTHDTRSNRNATHCIKRREELMQYSTSQTSGRAQVNSTFSQYLELINAR